MAETNGCRVSSGVAVVGMACRLPGKVFSPAEFWRFLMRCGDGVRPGPFDRWDAEAFHLPGVTGRSAARHAGLLDEINGFDAAYFGISAREAEAMDPQHRLWLELCWEALEHAGIPHRELEGTRAGVFFGVYNVDQLVRLGGRFDELDGYVMTGGTHSVGVGRVSYLLGARGPSVSVDTACSSSAAAIHFACQSLLSGESDIVLAGGANALLTPEPMVSMSGWSMLSVAGRCHAFDARADGFVRGEGGGAVVLKRLADARRDGDAVWAVIRGSGVNHDGRSDGLTAPSGQAQVALFEDVVGRAGVDPATVGFLEAHGPGTPIGDPIEFDSLARVYGDGRYRCPVGSVKTNIGHLESAAGVASLIKTVLCLHHGVIPANLGFERWNPRIDPEGTRLFVPTEAVAWAQPGRRRAAMSSYGVGGTNAHIVLEEAEPRRAAEDAPAAVTRSRHVVPVSAGSAAALRTTATRLAEHLADSESQAADLPDLVHTLAVRRTARPERLAVCCADAAELRDQLLGFADGRPDAGAVTGSPRPGADRGVVWVFSGHGSQWAGMGGEMLAAEPVFAEVIDRLEPLIRQESGFSVRHTIESAELSRDVGEVQPAIFAVQLGLAALWRANGVEPAAVIGHSMGEVSAAVACGLLGVEDGVRVICRRSNLMRRIAGAGAMASVALPAREVEADLEGLDGVAVAVVASSRSTVVSGDLEAVSRTVAVWERRGLHVRLVDVDVASHCPHVEAIMDDLRSSAEPVRPRSAVVEMYSTVDGHHGEQPAANADYWANNLRRPVRYADAVRRAADDGYTTFLEVAPHPLLLHPTREVLTERGVEAVTAPTMRRGENPTETFTSSFGALYCAGAPIDWRRGYGTGSLTSLPTTAWEHQRYSIELPPPHPARQRTDEFRHPLLGAHTEVPGTGQRHVWRADLGTRAVPWLADHRVRDTPVLPGAAYCEMFLAATTTHFHCEPTRVALDGACFHRLLPLGEHTTVHTTLTPTDHDRARIEVRVREGDEWVTHAEASAVVRQHRADVVDFDAIRASTPRAEDPATLYAGMRQRGYHHGPAFAGITALSTDDSGNALAQIELPVAARSTTTLTHLPPALLDTALQVLASLALAQVPEPDTVLLPTGIEKLRIYGPLSRVTHCQAELGEPAADGSFQGNLSLLADDGAVLARACGVRFASPDPQDTLAHLDPLLHEVRWEPAPLPEQPHKPRTSRWLVVGEESEDRDRLHQKLTGAGVVCASATSIPAQAGDSGIVLLVPPGNHDHTETSEALQRVLKVLEVIQALASAEHVRLWIVTRGAQCVARSDRPALHLGGVRGLARVAMTEQPNLQTTLVDLDHRPEAIDDLGEELLTGSGADEIAWRAGKRYLARLFPAPLSNSDLRTRPRRPVSQDTGFSMRPAQAGSISAFVPVLSPRRPPGPRQVEIRVHAAALNYKDVLEALEVIRRGDRGGELGVECAGTVTATGQEVTHVQVGDRVAALAPHTPFGSFSLADERLCAPVPETMAMADAACVPAAYTTAWYGLVHLARLAKGEVVLIHAGTGGVGLAAINVARGLGADIIATAGSDRKRRYLHELGVEHVLDSRSLAFAAQVREITAGRGVDVVLNSLSGLALRAGVEALAVGGRFIELGKRDIEQGNALDLGPFRNTLTFSNIDLALTAEQRPDQAGSLLREVFAEITTGHLPLLPRTDHRLAQLAEAFREMANARHIGKLAVTVPADGATEAILPPGIIPLARADGAYFITGGLRGLGLRTAQHLADHGAGQLVLNGRNAPDTRAEQILNRISGRGTRVDIVLGDIAAPDTATRMVERARASGYTPRGVIHSAVVLDDAPLTALTAETVQNVWLPKVNGAVRLHEATAGHPLDYFVLFSSMTSLFGNPGQGNYTAANSWLDSFAHWRRSRRLPALAINWGAWGEAGRATDMANRGYTTIRTQHGLDALAALIDHDRTQLAVAPYEPRQWFHAAPHAARSSLFATMPDEPEAGTSQEADLRTRLAATSTAERARIATEHVETHLRTVLGLPVGRSIDRSANLTTLGIDSLTSLQLRNAIATDLGHSLPVSALKEHPTITTLARYLLVQLDLPREDRGDRALATSVAGTTTFRALHHPPRTQSVVYCFPPAGGNPADFLPFVEHLPHTSALHGLELARGHTSKAPPAPLISIAEQLANTIAGQPHPFVLFGHSAGSLLAFETARALRHRHDRLPEALVVSSCVAPHRTAPELRPEGFTAARDARATLDDAVIYPPWILDDPDARLQARADLEADIDLFDAYRYDAIQPLECPILAVGGEEDPLIPATCLDEWKTHTEGSFTRHTFAGGHFYLKDHSSALAAELVAQFTSER